MIKARKIKPKVPYHRKPQDLTLDAWQAALASGLYAGSADDLRDGFIHLSTAAQLPATLAKHFAARADLVVVAVVADRLGAALKWEVSRGGALFPHLYRPLPVAAVVWWKPLELAADGSFRVPAEIR